MHSDNKDNSRKWRDRAFTAWAIIGLCVLIGVACYIAGIIWQAVAIIIVTALTVFLLHGVVNSLQEKGLPRWAGTALCFVVLSGIILGCVCAFIPAIIEQLVSFTNNIPGYIVRLQDFASTHIPLLGDDTRNVLNEALNNATAWAKAQSGTLVSGLAGGVIGIGVGIGNFVIIAFMSLICSIWILVDLPKISQEVRSLFSDDLQDDLDIFGDAFGRAVYGWAKSTLICAIITGLASGIAFWICNIPYSAVLGFLCGVLYLIPYVGSMISCVIVAIIALFVSPVTCAVSIVINVLLNNIVGNIISPKLMKSSVNVHPAIVLVAITIGSALGGMAGMLLSIPIVGALQGVFVTYYEARTGKTLATEDGVLFQKKKEAKLPNFDTGKWHLH